MNTTTILIIFGIIGLLIYFFYPKKDTSRKALSPRVLYENTFTVFYDTASKAFPGTPPEDMRVEVNRLVREWAYQQIANLEPWQQSSYKAPGAKKNMTFWEYFKAVIDHTNK